MKQESNRRLHIGLAKLTLLVEEYRDVDELETIFEEVRAAQREYWWDEGIVMPSDK
jgi:hypothetical protein